MEGEQVMYTYIIFYIEGGDNYDERVIKVNKHIVTYLVRLLTYVSMPAWYERGKDWGVRRKKKEKKPAARRRRRRRRRRQGKPDTTVPDPENQENRRHEDAGRSAVIQSSSSSAAASYVICLSFWIPYTRRYSSYPGRFVEWVTSLTPSTRYPLIEDM